MKNLFKLFFTFTLMFAANEGFSTEISVEKLYHDSLKKEYSLLLDLKEKAEQRKTAYIVSGILAFFLLLGFIYFFKLNGLILALIMIGAGYYTLKSSQPVVGAYEKQFKRDILSPITRLVAGFRAVPGKLSEEDLETSGLFAPRIKEFSSWDLYQKEGAKFSYIHVVFDTKENASLERMSENIFEGFLIMIEANNKQEGVLVSQSLRDKVAHMDMTMGSFFAKGKRAGSENGFDIYGEVSQEARDKLLQIRNQKIAISYQKDKTIIVLYHQSNPLSVDVFKSFDLLQAQHYAASIAEIDNVIQIVK